MKFTFVLPVGVAMLILQGCSTPPRWNDRQAYETRIGGGDRMLDVLQALDTGGAEQMRRTALQEANRMLVDLPAVAANAYLTAADTARGTAFARDLLNYELAHKDELAGSGADVGLIWLKRILTEPEDVRRLTELEGYLAGAGGKPPTNKLKMDAAQAPRTNQSDAEISRKIVGTWIVDVDLLAYSAKGTETFAPDGSYVAKATVIQNGRSRDEAFAGKWQVKDGFLIATNFMHDQVVQVDANQLVCLSGTNSTRHTYLRSK